METELRKIRDHFIALLQKSSQEWKTAEIAIRFPPYSNKGYERMQVFKDHLGNKVRINFRMDEEGENMLSEFIRNYNQSDQYNEIVITEDRSETLKNSISVHFSKEVDDAFKSMQIPSQIGKIKAWYKK